MLVMDAFLWLILYSFIGWAYESALCSASAGKWINRGFLSGPLCPIYGVGAMISVACLYGRTQSVTLLFLGGMLLCCSIEYVTALLLERLFNERWWDYSSHRFHYKGRVSLAGAVVFGTLSMLLVRFIHPAVMAATGHVPVIIRALLALALGLLLLRDLASTVSKLRPGWMSLLPASGTLAGLFPVRMEGLRRYAGRQYRRGSALLGYLVERFYKDRDRF